jgi:probable phosphoglycerate mutase
VLGARWIGSPVSTAQHFLLSTASLSILSGEHGRLDRPAIELWNDVSHKVRVAETRPVPPA